MSLGRTYAVALLGAGGSLVEIEADLANGLPGLNLIGLPDRALGEAADRVRSAVVNAGLSLPARKLTVNLSPAALPKQGSGFDLGIALSVLCAAGLVPPESLASTVHFGELSLDGRLRPTPGSLPAVIAARAAGFTRVMVPAGNAAEAELVPGMTIVPVSSLGQAAIAHGAEIKPIDVPPLVSPTDHPVEAAEPTLDLSEVVGNHAAIDAVITAAAGGHHLFMLGPPGAGKTMLAARLPGILPDLSLDDALEVASIASLSGARQIQALSLRPPFEAPHHGTTMAAMVGGGSANIKPGAIARASHGVLFLDEAPEFPTTVLDALRQPLESGAVTIQRAASTATFPARFQLVLAANPCPCGQLGVSDRDCTCAPILRRRYLQRLSGPLLDRVDLHVTVDRVSAVIAASADGPYISTAHARAQVEEARAIMAERLQSTGWQLNSQVSGAYLRSRLRLAPAVTKPLDRALERGHITMRGYDRVLRVAWTLADLEGATTPTTEHLSRGLFLRKGIQ